MIGEANREAVIEACVAALKWIEADRQSARDGMIATQMKERTFWLWGSYPTREEAIAALSYPFSDYKNVGITYAYWEDRLKVLMKGAVLASGDTVSLSAQDFDDIRRYYTRDDA